ncbi:MAG: hypothetical protein M1569_03400 [Candidatus Marsarchaeota archaeon]|nr:hypothetical protein [Candidatus Marsarchaeota archaeon]MCL5413422.1 hypothetical protein [Candidatus Marsarchaeota archaeon]
MNNYTPKLTLTQRLQHLKYAKLEIELKPLCKWVDFYDYIWSYSSIDWKGKKVLDIGADIGSSALFYLMNGADYVYLLEKEQEYKTTYETIKQKYHILKNSVMLSSLADMPNDINVLKMDCEGCELSLLTEELLNKSKEFVIGLHKPQLDDYKFEQKKRLLEKHGAKYFGNVNNEEFVWVKKA